MRVCDCYRRLEPLQLMVGECLGAKNKPRVDCDGDESRCLFYSDRRRKAKVVTNVERLRSMTDEELAEWFDRHTSEPLWCVWSILQDCPDHEDCRKCILKWLKAPVEPGEVDNG